MKNHCCDQLTACIASVECACILACLGDGNLLARCVPACGVQQPPPELLAVFECNNTNCGAQCQ